MKREEETVSVSVVVESELLERIDARAKALDLNRSQYLRRLAREDLDREKVAKQLELHTQPAAA